MIKEIYNAITKTYYHIKDGNIVSTSKVSMAKLKIGDKVSKPKGYRFDAVVVSVFKTTTGKTRIVAENRDQLLHIFNEKQLSKI